METFETTKDEIKKTITKVEVFNIKELEESLKRINEQIEKTKELPDTVSVSNDAKIQAMIILENEKKQVEELLNKK